jgi:signal transduction histidine kinase
MTSRSNILVIDDSTLTQAIVTDVLCRSGHVVSVAQSRRQAFETVPVVSPDLILLDLVLPDGDGLEVLRALRQPPYDLTIPIIVVTCCDRDEHLALAFKAGANDYIFKPFSEVVLEARVEAALRAYRNAQELRFAREAAEAATKARTEFLASMSHEIRTPMTAILGYAEILLGEEGISKAPVERRRAYEIIQRNGEYLLELINDILDLSKIESGQFDVEGVACSPWQVAAEVISLLQIRALEKGLELSLEARGPLPATVWTDPTRLRQVLVNLVGNAVKFTERGSVKLVLELQMPEEAPPRLRFEVIDTGIGISPEQMTRLFRPFSQAERNTARYFGGTGLGLALCRQLVEKLGGSIGVQSQRGVGSTFWFTIATGPLDDVPLLARPQEIVPEVAPRRSKSAAAPLQCRVLLAEDGPDNQRLIAFILRKAGAEVTVAENGAIALGLALAARDEGAPYHVILMDMQMPVMDGYEATRKLRSADYKSPIVALTAHAMSEDRQKCLDAGCDEFLTKPIDRARLIDAMARYGKRVECAATLVGLS